ncbi:MAG TPA: hypothetical protein VNQ77_16425, partial [Frankiaceae bacterium]|nr:hypothetical protein [Frankiaceae bacterium]
KKETLVELSSDELGGVVGASFPSKYDCTESYQVCHEITKSMCAATIGTCVISHRIECIPTQGC